MNSPSKTFKRLGIVGAAAVVGLVPIGVLSTSAYAASNVTTSASLGLASNSANIKTTATNTLSVAGLTSTNEVQTITITATGETLPVASPATTGDVLVNGAPATFTGATGSSIEITGLAITSGTSIVVTIQTAQNPSSGVVYVSDQTNLDATPVVSNSEPITATTATTASVSGVNPSAFSSGALGAANATPANLTTTATAGEQFTVIGTGFTTPPSGSTTPTAYIPAVCFYPSTTPSTDTLTYVSGTGCETNNALDTTAVLAVDTVAVSPTEIQGAVTGLTKGMDYNVVVFDNNNNVYTAASTTSSASLVAVSTVTAGLSFVPESGIRVVNTTLGMGLPSGTLTPGEPYGVPLATFENSAAVPTNVPTSATALSLNVTAVAPAGPGNLQVWAASTCTSTTRPETSTVNFQNPNDTSNSTVLAVSATNNVVCVQDNGAAVNVILDVTGYGVGTAFTGTTARILDTRIGSPTQTGSIQGALQGGTVYQMDVPTADAAAGTTVALNVTAVNPSSVGNLRVFPQNGSTPPSASGVPTTSVVTYIPGTDASSLFVTNVGSSGVIDLYSAGTGTVNVVVDLVGTFATNGNVVALSAPTRLMDTRPGGAAAGSTTMVTVPALNVPGSTTNLVPLGVIGDLGDINPASVGNLRTFPGGGAVPGTSSINNYPGQTRSTTAVVATNPGTSQISVYSAGSSTNFTFDESGYIY